jgi:hypothetical protein
MSWLEKVVPSMERYIYADEKTPEAKVRRGEQADKAWESMFAEAEQELRRLHKKAEEEAGK